MCGIFAALNVHIDPSVVSECMQAIRHRGPDDSGMWRGTVAPVWMGHQRLAILDLSDGGKQPMHNEDQSVVMVCNGEIYNYYSLRERLEGLGHRLYSNCDSEIILHAYEEWGDQCVEKLEGMFAFALWDEKQHRFFAARDRVGIKPLYYMEAGDGLIVSSEAQVLLPFLKPAPEPDPLALAYVMTLGYIPSPLSIWRGISKLEPGHMLVWTARTRLVQRKYWEPPRHIDHDKKNDPAEWRSLFEKVLDEHLLSDVPVGLFLSGGLDSSALAAGLAGADDPVQAITVSFPDSSDNEAPIAASTAQHLGLTHDIIPIQTQDIGDLIPEVVSTFDEPQGFSALLSMYVLSRAAAKKYKVALAGDGGDEVFGGYTWYDNLDFRPSHYVSGCVRRLLRPFVYRYAGPGIRQKTAEHFCRLSPLHRHAWRLYPRFLPEEAASLLQPTGLRFGDEELLAPLQKHFEPTLPLKRALQRVDLMTFCTDSILAKVDRASMAHSLEVRVPFLDRRIVEWALPTPVDEQNSAGSKAVLRKYLANRVPPEVLSHPKQGFSIRGSDTFDWDQAISIIRESVWIKNGYWTPDWEHLVAPGVPYRTARIWNLLSLTHWAEFWLQ